MRSAEAESRTAEGALPVTIVTLSAPGFTLRVASEPIEIEDSAEDGPYFYDAGLISASDVSPEIDLFSEERPAITRSQVSLLMPADWVPAEMERQGQHLAASRCEVAQIWPEQAWKDRRVWIGRGTVSGLRLGIAGEPVSFVVEALPPRVGAPVGQASRTIDTTPLISTVSGTIGYPPQTGFTSLEGKEIPIIVGRVYRVPGFKIGDAWTLGDGIAGKGLLIVAGAHFANSAATLTFYDDGVVFVPGGTLYNETDENGDPLVVHEGAAITDFTASDGAITIDAGSGGVPAAFGSGAALGASGVLAWLLAQSGEPVDWAAMQYTIKMLEGWEIGLYVDRQADALAAARERLVRLLPIVEEQGPNGLWFRFADPFLQAPVADLVLGQDLVGRIGGLEQVTDPDDLRNEITIYYFYDHYIGRYTKSVTVTGTNNPLCALSTQLYGRRVATSINCNVCWDDATALQIAHSKLNRLALPRFGARYLADAPLYWLREGMVVRLTDDDLGLSTRRCVVRQVAASMAPFEIVLEMVPGMIGTVGA